MTVICKARCDEATAQLNCPAQPSLTTVNSSRTPIDRWVLGGPVEDDAGVDRTCLRMRCENTRVFSHTNWNLNCEFLKFSVLVYNYWIFNMDQGSLSIGHHHM